jgi:hypothetical protein
VPRFTSVSPRFRLTLRFLQDLEDAQRAALAAAALELRRRARAQSVIPREVVNWEHRALEREISESANLGRLVQRRVSRATTDVSGLLMLSGLSCARRRASRTSLAPRRKSPESCTRACRAQRPFSDCCAKSRPQQASSRFSVFTPGRHPVCSHVLGCVAQASMTLDEAVHARKTDLSRTSSSTGQQPAYAAAGSAATQAPTGQ